jgi:hypothetical protein
MYFRAYFTNQLTYFRATVFLLACRQPLYFKCVFHPSLSYIFFMRFEVLMVVTVKIMSSWEECAASIFRLRGGNMFFWDISKHLSYYTVSYPRRQWSSYFLPHKRFLHRNRRVFKCCHISLWCVLWIWQWIFRLHRAFLTTCATSSF